MEVRRRQTDQKFLSWIFTDIRVFLGALVAIFGLWAAAPAVGLNIPRWTWIDEHNKLAFEVAMLSQEFQMAQLVKAEKRYFSLGREIKEFEERNLAVPVTLSNEWLSIGREVSLLKRKLGIVQ